MKKRLLYTFVLFLFSISLSLAQTEKFYAVYIYNFTKYMQWEDNGSSDFVISVVGNEELVKYLNGVAASKTVGAKTIVVKSASSASAASGSQIIFIGASKKSELGSARSISKSSNALLISETEGDAMNGAGISFKMAGGKLSFDIHKGNISASKILVNAKLEALGTVVG